MILGTNSLSLLSVRYCMANCSRHLLLCYVTFTWREISEIYNLNLDETIVHGCVGDAFFLRTVGWQHLSELGDDLNRISPKINRLLSVMPEDLAGLPKISFWLFNILTHPNLRFLQPLKQPMGIDLDNPAEWKLEGYLMTNKTVGTLVESEHRFIRNRVRILVKIRAGTRVGFVSNSE